MMDCEPHHLSFHQLTGGPMLYSGIDLHRRSIVICTVNAQGTVVARAKLRTEPDNVVKYFRQWTEPHHAVVECTSN